MLMKLQARVEDAESSCKPLARPWLRTSPGCCGEPHSDSSLNFLTMEQQQQCEDRSFILSGQVQVQVGGMARIQLDHR